MVKDILFEKEEIVYQTLSNALKNNRLSQMILLSGPKNPLKLDTAFLLAQSIIEGKSDFACERCDLCRRIKNNEYFDLLFIDGSEKTIIKEDIEMMYDRFKETALEKYGKKVFIINNINNATIKVLNMLLKFVEEPKDNIYGILITDEIDSLLSTIKSRCQIIPFKEATKSDFIEFYLKDGFEKLDAYFLSEIFHNYIKIEMNDELYLLAKDMVDITIDNLNNIYMLEIEYANRIYTYKDKQLKKLVDMYISLMIIYLNDAISNCYLDELEYKKQLEKIKRQEVYKLLDIFMSAKDKLRYAYDRKLVLDEVVYLISQIKCE